MAHRIVVGEQFVEVIHSGEVGYRDRLKALEDVNAHDGIRPGIAVLINFTDASLQSPLSRDDAGVRERVDYMARAAVDAFFEGRRVAMVGALDSDVRPASVAAQIRKLTFRVFSEREQAIDWLLSGR